MRRYEAYPTIRARAGMPSLPRVAVLAGAVGIAALALFMLPALLGIGGGGAASPSPSASRPVVSANPTSTTAPAPSAQVYIIKEKDTLSKVAKRFGMTLEVLLAANPEIKNADKISVGQQIIIPSPSDVAASPAASAAP
jgi:nucleoid-associated protein YgaU